VNKTYTSKSFRWYLEYIPVRISSSMRNSTALSDILLIRYTAVLIASPHKYRGTFIKNNKHLVTSMMCLLFSSATPFCSGVFTHIV
jgi:hypothetical protein